jgi:hypothetical protein
MTCVGRMTHPADTHDPLSPKSGRPTGRPDNSVFRVAEWRYLAAGFLSSTYDVPNFGVRT